MIFIGPPHFGQHQRSGKSSVEEACCSACGSCTAGFLKMRILLANNGIAYYFF
jgi:hypothetical protein